MNRYHRIIFLALIVVLIGVGGWGSLSTQAQLGSNANHHWILKSQRPVIIGGFGDNFNYDGSNVRPLVGFSVLDVDTASKTGTVVATLTTTEESGPLFVAKTVTVENGIEKVTHEYLNGEIRLEMEINPDDARFQEFEWLHGNTGNEAPVMPDLFNYLAGWAPIDVFVNGELAYDNFVGHFMYSEQARREDGTIRRNDGATYSPKLADKSRFANANGREFHLVAHTSVPDENNFPPHTHWIHLVFFDVFAQKIPSKNRGVTSGSLPGESAEPPSPGLPTRPQIETNTEANTESGEQTGAPVEKANANHHVVLMRRDGGNFVFDPPALHIHLGDTVTWLNADVPHTTTSYNHRIPDGAEGWDSGFLAFGDAGFTFAHTFAVEGTYDYYCQPHEFAGMAGRIVVGQPGGPGEGDDFVDVSAEAIDKLNSLPSGLIISAKGLRFQWAAAINLVYLNVFERNAQDALASAQALVDNAAQLSDVLGDGYQSFETLLKEYQALVTAGMSLETLSRKNQELKDMLDI